MALPEEAKAETMCRHGQPLQDDVGCEALCKNKLCRHPCATHGMNCLQIVGLDGQKRPVYCPCVGLEW